MQDWDAINSRDSYTYTFGTWKPSLNGHSVHPQLQDSLLYFTTFFFFVLLNPFIFFLGKIPMNIANVASFFLWEREGMSGSNRGFPDPTIRGLQVLELVWFGLRGRWPSGSHHSIHHSRQCLGRFVSSRYGMHGRIQRGSIWGRGNIGVMVKVMWFQVRRCPDIYHYISIYIYIYEL